MTAALSLVNGRKTLITLPESGGGSGGILTASASNLIWCIAGGSYATGQAAVNAASDGQSVLFGPKAGGWGDIVLPASKRINLIGLNADRGLVAEIKSLTFSPSAPSGSLNINENEIAVNNLYINQTALASSAFVFSGDRPGRIRLYGCFIYAGSGTADLIAVSNTGANSSCYFENCNIQSGTASSRILMNVSSYVRMRRCDVSGGSKSLLVSSGIFECADSNFECNQTAEVITLTGGLSYLGKCVIKNTVSNGSGIAMTSPAFLSFGMSGFAVNSGTGYCIRGTGTVLYDRLSFSHSSFSAQNVKFQNTLSLFTYTTAATVTA